MQYMWMCRYISLNYYFCFLDINAKGGFVGQTELLFEVFNEISILFSIKAEPDDILTNHE